MSVNRVRCRNVNIFDGRTGMSFGGMRQNGSVTRAMFLDMLNRILLVASLPLSVIHRSSGRTISHTDLPLDQGEYDVFSDSAIFLNDELWVHRIMSHSISDREDSFKVGVRNRDRKCVISGMENEGAEDNDWSYFEAAHVFPLEREDYWNEKGYANFITDLDGTVGDSKLNSVQNGLLLRSDIHTAFDNYLIGIDPDSGFKIIVFGRDSARLDGRSLDEVCRSENDPRSVSPQLLRWHFRQCVLANMRGAGEPIFDCDHPPGTDSMKEIREGPYSRERFELELSARLQKPTTLSPLEKRFDGTLP